MIHVDNGESAKSNWRNNSRIFRGKSPPLNSNLKSREQAQNLLTETPVNTEFTSTRRPGIEHTKERTHGVFYPKKNMKRANEQHNRRRDHYKFKKQHTAQQLATGGSGGIVHTAFSATNPSGASVGGQLGKWSGEITAHRNVSAISSEEVKRMRKEPTHLSDQTAFRMGCGRSGMKQPSILDNNFDASFSNSDIDIMQNPEEYEREHVPHQIHTSHLELSDGHSVTPPANY